MTSTRFAPTPTYRRDRVRGISAYWTAVTEGLSNISHRKGMALLLVSSVALGVSLAIAIITASRGVEYKVISLLAIDPQPPGIDFDEVYDVLYQTRNLLTKLAYGSTVVLVSFVTWLSFSRRRREIGVKRSRGFYVSQLLVELWTEATLLCLVGGLIGVAFGYAICNALQNVIPSLPLEPETSDIRKIFPTAVMISFIATGAVASWFSVKPSKEVDL